MLHSVAGLQTAFAISPEQSWAVSGTSSGHLSCWDLRFQLPVVACSHPAEARIRQLLVQPGAASTVMAAVHGNNEVGFWNMESQFRQLVLWASPAPLLSNTTVRSSQK
jgi:phosphoinositide-3-kinase regulatory subunit 4